MYQALYRKYRPQTFADVVGQEAIVTTLCNQTQTGKFSHAYLFTGSRGTGKTTCSKLLAKAINCQHVTDGQPCGVCEICKGIENDSMLDVVEMDAASNNGVDNIRALKEEAYFVPAICQKRVYIIDEAHMLSGAAFNALLKTLEEPPQHVVFILATTEVHKLPITILSRCQRFDFARITPPQIAQRLVEIAQKEAFSLPQDAALFLAKLADGGMRDALSLLDKCASSGEEITLDLVKELCGATDFENVVAMADFVLDRDMGGAMKLLADLYGKSVSMSGFVTELLSHFRNLMLAKVVSDLQSVVPCTPQEKQRLLDQAGKITGQQSMSLVSTLTDGVEKLQKSAAPRVSAEMLLIALIQQLMGQGGSAIAPVADTAYIASIPQPKPQSPVENVAPTTPPATPAPEGKFAQWDDVLAIIEGKNKMVYTALVGSNAYVDGNLLLIDSKSELFLNLMRTNAKTSGDIKDAVRQVSGQVYRLGPYRAPETSEQPPQNKLDDLINTARASGIDVTVKENQPT